MERLRALPGKDIDPIGYLREIAMADPKSYGRLLTRVVAHKFKHPDSDESSDEIDELLRAAPQQEFARTLHPDKLALADAILLVAHQVGQDGRGKNGLSGYFTSVVCPQPKLSVRLVCLILDDELN